MDRLLNEYTIGHKVVYKGQIYEFFDWENGGKTIIIESAYPTEGFITGEEFIPTYTKKSYCRAYHHLYYKRISPDEITDTYHVDYEYYYLGSEVSVRYNDDHTVNISIKDYDLRKDEKQKEKFLSRGFKYVTEDGEHSWETRCYYTKENISIDDSDLEIKMFIRYLKRYIDELDGIKRKYRENKKIYIDDIDVKAIWSAAADELFKRKNS